jgi:hypothetical protein
MKRTVILGLAMLILGSASSIANAYTAIAWSESGQKGGTVKNAPTKEAAMSAALADCKKQGGGADCQVFKVTDEPGFVALYATCGKTCGVTAVAGRATAEQARVDAKRDCEAHYKNPCQLAQEWEEKVGGNRNTSPPQVAKTLPTNQETPLVKDIHIALPSNNATCNTKDECLKLWEPKLNECIRSFDRADQDVSESHFQQGINCLKAANAQLAETNEVATLRVCLADILADEQAKEQAELSDPNSIRGKQRLELMQERERRAKVRDQARERRYQELERSGKTGYRYTRPAVQEPPQLSYDQIHQKILKNLGNWPIIGIYPLNVNSDGLSAYIASRVKSHRDCFASSSLGHVFIFLSKLNNQYSPKIRAVESKVDFEKKYMASTEIWRNKLATGSRVSIGKSRGDEQRVDGIVKAINTNGSVFLVDVDVCTKVESQAYTPEIFAPCMALSVLNYEQQQECGSRDHYTADVGSEMRRVCVSSKKETREVPREKIQWPMR